MMQPFPGQITLICSIFQPMFAHCGRSPPRACRTPLHLPYPSLCPAEVACMGWCSWLPPLLSGHMGRTGRRSQGRKEDSDFRSSTLFSFPLGWIWQWLVFHWLLLSDSRYLVLILTPVPRSGITFLPSSPTHPWSFLLPNCLTSIPPTSLEVVLHSTSLTLPCCIPAGTPTLHRCCWISHTFWLLAR